MRILLTIILVISMFSFAYANDQFVLVADSVVKSDNDTLEATGNVTLKTKDTVFSSDRLSYNSKTKQIDATGNVKIKSDTQSLEADSFTYNIETETGKAKSVKGFLEPSNFICAEEFEKTGDVTFSVLNARISTCEGDIPDWSIQMYKGEYEIEGYLNAEHATADIKNSPLIYLPKLVYPVATKRKSGFLLPNIGIDSEKGAFANIKYFWAPTDNFDTTLGTTLFSKSGIQQQVEIRYADSADSNLYTVFNRIDDQTSLSNELSRWHLISVNKYTFFDNFEMNLNIDLTSDYLYTRDFNKYDLVDEAYAHDNKENMFYAEFQSGYYSKYADIIFYTRTDKQYRDSGNGHQITSLTQTPSINVSKTIPLFSSFVLAYQLAYDSLAYDTSSYNTQVTGQTDISYDRFLGDVELFLPIDIKFATLTPSVEFDYTYWFNTSEPFNIVSEYKQPFSGIAKASETSAYRYQTSSALSLNIKELYKEYPLFRHSIQNIVKLQYSPNLLHTGIPALTDIEMERKDSGITYEMINFFSSKKWNAYISLSQTYDWLQTGDMLPINIKSSFSINDIVTNYSEIKYKHSGKLSANEQRLQYLTNTANINIFNHATLVAIYTFDSTIQSGSNNTDLEFRLYTNIWRFSLGGFYRWAGYNAEASVANLLPSSQGATAIYHDDCWSLGFEFEVDNHEIITQTGKQNRDEFTFYLNFTLKGIGGSRIEFLQID